jgi:DNA-directed RNA polymerase specialized sigma24 family protein
LTDDERLRTDATSPAGEDAEAGTGEVTAADTAAVQAANAAAEAEVAALAEVIGRFHDDMARVGFVVSGDVELAGDAAWGAWPEAWKDRATPRSAETLRPWLLGLAAKEAKWLSDAGARARADAARGDAGEIATQAASTAAYKSEELDLANSFAAMDSHDRQIVALRYVGGLSSDEIGRELGMPGSAVQARVARILKDLLQAVKNLAPAGASIEEYERALAQRIRAFSTRAVAPLDPEALARSAIAQAAAELSSVDRLAGQLQGVVERLRETSPIQLAAVGGVMVVAFAFLFLGRGGGAAIATPIPTDATRECASSELELRVTKWEPAGNDRVASVEMHNIGGVACLVDNLPEPWLVEAPQMPMLIGSDVSGTLVRIGPGDTLHSRVRVRNYCGPDPRAPVTIAFRRGTSVLVAQALNGTDVSGVPPCGGYATTPSDITMSAWSY